MGFSRSCRRKCGRKVFIPGACWAVLFVMVYYDSNIFNIGGYANRESIQPLLRGANNASSSDLCTPVTNVYFMKVHKTGSTTMFGILARVAIAHRLRVVTYAKRPYNTERDIHQAHSIIRNIIPNFTVGADEKYNMLIDHSYFHLQDIQAVLKAPIVFWAMLRNPFDRVRSWLYFIGEGKQGKQTKDSTQTNSSYNDPMRITKHFSSMGWISPFVRIFGYESTTIDDMPQLIEFINYIDDTFLVGITEYYDQSVILMKRRMCWSLQDVIYLEMRKQKYHKHITFDQAMDTKLRERLCELNKEECYFYDHFNKTFWKRVSLEGADFYQEVAHFQSIQNKVSDFCHLQIASSNGCSSTDATGARSTCILQIGPSKWNSKFNITADNCRIMTLSETGISNFNYYTQNKEVCPGLLVSSSKTCSIKPTGEGPLHCDKLCEHYPNREMMLRGLIETSGSCMTMK